MTILTLLGEILMYLPTARALLSLFSRRLSAFSLSRVAIYLSSYLDDFSPA